MMKCVVRSCPVDGLDDLWYGFVEYIVQGLKYSCRTVILEQMVSAVSKGGAQAVYLQA